MFQMRKLRFCRTFANFFQCYFMSETQVLVAVSDFLDFHFLGNISRMVLHFSMREFVFQLVLASFLGVMGCSVGALILTRFFSKSMV